MNAVTRAKANAKREQGYDGYPPSCCNCDHFIPPVQGVPQKKPYKAPQCGLGKFNVRYYAICNKWTNNGEVLE